MQKDKTSYLLFRDHIYAQQNKNFNYIVSFVEGTVTLMRMTNVYCVCLDLPRMEEYKKYPQVCIVLVCTKSIFLTAGLSFIARNSAGGPDWTFYGQSWGRVFNNKMWISQCETVCLFEDPFIPTKHLKIYTVSVFLYHSLLFPLSCSNLDHIKASMVVY